MELKYKNIYIVVFWKSEFSVLKQVVWVGLWRHIFSTNTDGIKCQVRNTIKRGGKWVRMSAAMLVGFVSPLLFARRCDIWLDQKPLH